MFVFFPEDEKVGIKTIKTYCQRMQEENITRAIIIVQVGMSPSAKQVNIDKNFHSKQLSNPMIASLIPGLGADFLMKIDHQINLVIQGLLVHSRARRTLLHDD